MSLILLVGLKTKFRHELKSWLLSLLGAFQLETKSFFAGSPLTADMLSVMSLACIIGYASLSSSLSFADFFPQLLCHLVAFEDLTI